MKIKLTSNSKEGINHVFERFCNVLSLAAQGGAIANDRDRNEPGASGKYWWMPNETKIDFFPAANDYWGWIVESTETSKTISIRARYDGGQKILNAAIELFDVIVHHSVLGASFEILEQ